MQIIFSKQKLMEGSNSFGVRMTSSALNNIYLRQFLH